MAGGEHHYMDEDGVARLHEPQYEVPRRGMMESDEEENSLFSYLGIVKTTEIEVTVEGTEGRPTSNAQTGRPTPWLEDEAP